MPNSEHTSKQFDADLEDIRSRVLQMGGLVEEAIRRTRASLVGEVRALLAAEGTAALLVTHDHSEAELLAHRALVLVDGVPAQVGPVHDIVMDQGREMDHLNDAGGADQVLPHPSIRMPPAQKHQGRPQTLA